ncbi:hypothetical protein V8G54_009293 [Vigna mungo]|uniref:Uncharacterized protein n=1 Tax=Vigna mungo TaxID=3915 RepID=A0AAQ3NWG1_VIGMU
MGWFSSSKETSSSDRTYSGGNFRGSSAEFSIEVFNDQKGVKLIDNAQKKMITSNSCWQNAYQHLFAGCSEILAVDEKRAYAFKHETERLVTELKSSAQYVEDKLDNIEEKSEHLLQGSQRIHDSLDLIGSHTEQVAQTARHLEGHIESVLIHSQNVYEQTTKIALSQSQLQEEIGKLRDKAIEIENEVIKVGDAMSSRMNTLQTKAKDIGNMAGLSLDKQHQLLDGQSTALESLNSLIQFQSKALEESR